MLIMDKKSNGNSVLKLFSRKVKEHTENSEIKVNIDIFYELFRLNMIQRPYSTALQTSQKPQSG